MLEAKTCVCPCGKGESYDITDIVCPECFRKATGGNFKTGEVTSWITQRAAAESQAIYEQQSFESDMNEWYGRGEW